MKAVPLYSIYIPATLEIYMEEVKSLVDFKMMEPDAIIPKIWANQTMMTLILGEPEIDDSVDLIQFEADANLRAAGISNTNLMQNM